MSENPHISDYNNQVQDQESNETIDIRKIFFLFLSKWIWFAASAFVALVIASFYLKVTPPKYTRSESILFVDNQKNGQSEIDNQLSEYISIGALQGSNNINDKILTLQNPMIMQEVVRHLGLDTNYMLKQVFKNQELYGHSPIALSYLDKSQTLPVEISIELIGNDKFQINEIKKYELTTKDYITLDKVYEGQFNDTIETTVGPLLITKTSFCNQNYTGKIIKVSLYPISMAGNLYSNSLGIQKVGKEANVIQITMTDTSKMRADAILKTLITVYNSNWLKDKNQIAVSTSEFINSRLAIIEKELNSVDHDINEFKSENKVTDIKEAGKEYMKQANESEERIFAMNTRISLAKYIRTSLDVLEGDYQLLPINSGLESAAIEGQINVYNNLLLKRNNLLSNSSEKNPLILQINQNLKALRSNMKQNLDELVHSTKLFIAEQKSNTTQREDNLTSNNPEKVSYLLSAERRQKVKETLYLFLLQKREQNELSKIFVAYSTKVINPPHGSASPISPKKKIIFLIALILGLGIPAALIYIMDLYDTDINSVEDLKHLTIPFIGTLPQMKGVTITRKHEHKTNYKPTIAVKEGLNDSLNEAFRNIRTNLNFMSQESSKGHVVMVTSIHPDSGKSFTSMNLAISIALCNTKSLVINADLRRGSLSQYIDNPEHKGLSLLLHDNKELIENNIIKGTLHPNVDIMPIGVTPPNPTELLMKPRFKKILDKVREDYDYIFVDCPPIDVISDTMIISKNVDTTLFIIRSKFADKRELPYIENLYKENTYPNMALILNGVVENHSKYGYGKYYNKYGIHSYNRYGYGYGYGYVNSSEEDEKSKG